MADRPATSRVAFGAYAREWVEHYRGQGARGCKENKRDDYRRLLNAHAIPFFDARRRTLAEVTSRDVAAFLEHLAGQGLAASTVTNIMAPVRRVFETAVAEGVIRTSPARGVPLWPLSGAQRPRALMHAELGRLLAELPDHHRLVVAFLASTGLRVGEAKALCWRDLDLDARWVLVRAGVSRGRRREPKTRAGIRDVPLAPSIVAALRVLREERGAGDDDPVWPTPTGAPLDHRDLLRRVVKPAAERARLGAITLHQLRHTVASALLAAGRTAVQTGAWLEHSNRA